MTAPIIPVTAKTPIYGIEYVGDLEPAFWMRARMQRNSEKLEALMAARALAPPAAADLAALSGRVTTLETAPLHLIAHMASGAAAVAQAVGWQEVPLGAELVDTHGGHALGTGKFVAPYTGHFRVSGAVAFAPTAGAILRAVQLVSNGRDAFGVTGTGGGGPVLGATQLSYYGAAGTYSVVPITPRRLYLTAGQWVALYSYSNAATTLAPYVIGDMGQQCFMEVVAA